MSFCWTHGLITLEGSRARIRGRGRRRGGDGGGRVLRADGAKRTIYPLLIGLQSIPKVGLAPLIIVWFGYGISSKVIMSFLFAFFPIVISTLGGLAGTPSTSKSTSVLCALRGG